MPAKAVWALGFLAGAGWSAANLLLISGILKISILQKPGKTLSALLLIKFPVLYLAGFLILNFRFFPVSSILAGLITVPVVMGIYKICQKT
jgi:hypothetical protein